MEINSGMYFGAGKTDPSGISVFEAVEEELGLKVVMQKPSMPVIVVDHVNDSHRGSRGENSDRELIPFSAFDTDMIFCPAYLRYRSLRRIFQLSSPPRTSLTFLKPFDFR
jgi:Protein of unknown function (DUF3738)